MKRVFIMRGVPGSGKSTMAKWIAENSPEEAVIHSTDQYFLDENGVYRYNPKDIKKNHNKNYKAFRDSIDSEIPVVIVDNTNTTKKEWAKYEDYAVSSGYWVSFVVLPHPTPKEAAERNTHGVPIEVIKKMIARFE